MGLSNVSDSPSIGIEYGRSETALEEPIKFIKHFIPNPRK